MLLLVDELSKAVGYANIVMAEIGTLLGNYTGIDILTSSLSPAYISDLVTCSRRSFVNITLINEILGKRECMEWAARIIARAEHENGESVEVFKKNILINFYKLMSGHPRSIQR